MLTVPAAPLNHVAKTQSGNGDGRAVHGTETDGRTDHVCLTGKITRCPAVHQASMQPKAIRGTAAGSDTMERSGRGELAYEDCTDERPTTSRCT